MPSSLSVVRVVMLLWFAGLLVFCAACADIQPVSRKVPAAAQDNAAKDPLFETETLRSGSRFASMEQIRTFSMAGKDTGYLIGPGDVLSLSVWGRSNVSAARMAVGPDGVITVPRIGFIQANYRTRESVADEIRQKLRAFYSDPEISLSIIEYKNNKAFVLGRVENPGVVNFPGRGTLLEALAIAGGYSTEAEDTYLTKCAIIRGHDTIIWIDLNELLQNGNMALNARIMNNDVIFIPESQTELIYVMGEVITPGAYNITGRLTLLDSLMLAGGPTDDAETTTLYLIRRTGEGKGDFREINLKELLESADFSKNYLMKDDDILYVTENRVSKFNYVLQKIFPSLEFIQMSTDILDNFGVMQEVRESLWGKDTNAD